MPGFAPSSSTSVARLLCLAVAFALVAILMLSAVMWNLALREEEKIAPLLKGDEPAVQAGIDGLASLSEAKARLQTLTGLSVRQQRTRDGLAVLTRKWAALTGMLSLIGLAMMWPLFRAAEWRASSR